jgi:hypothetical protein
MLAALPSHAILIQSKDNASSTLQIQSPLVRCGSAALDGMTTRPELVRSNGLARRGLFWFWGRVADRGPPPSAASPGACIFFSGEYTVGLSWVLESRILVIAGNENLGVGGSVLFTAGDPRGLSSGD